MIDFHPVFNYEDRSIEIKVKSNKIPPLVVDIPKFNKDRKRYISLFLHRGDILASKEILSLITDEKNNTHNETYFATALMYFMRCFQSCKKRVELDINNMPLVDEESKATFSFLRRIRNKHYAHDDSDMIRTLDFLLLTSKSGTKYDDMMACVIFNRVLPKFTCLAEKMLHLIDVVVPSIDVLIDQVGQAIVDEYKDFSINKIRKFGLTKLELADMDDFYLD
ncbi:MAG TPA: hypothetical protein DCY10_07415 [Clostridiales bacterium]|nr:hypothetical protein [Clostridiales bacterium]